MANKPICIITLRQIMLMHNRGDSTRMISDIQGVSRNTVRKYIQVFDALGLNYEEFKSKHDGELFRLFYLRQEETL